MTKDEWIRLDYENGKNFPPGIGDIDDPYILITDGKHIGVGDYSGDDCFEDITWLDLESDEDNRRYKHYIKFDDLDITITHWMPIPLVPFAKEKENDER